jgi:diguanylate cyclase (GGDEF)-like protein/putative nucleotidyltransferase with HDIG domain
MSALPPPSVIAAVLAFALVASVWLGGRHRRALRQRLEETKREVRDLSDLNQATLEAVTLAIDGRDPAATGHVRRVQRYALALARSMERPMPERQALRLAALLHDIGKVVVPDHVLSKPGRLSESEFATIRSHPEAGVAILAPAGLPEPVLRIIRHHHERWDGSGYPGRLSGEAIPAGARILAVVDAFEALTSDRAYRARVEPAEALALVEAWSGVQFDPAVVRALKENLPTILAAGAHGERLVADPPERRSTEAAGHAPDAGGFGDALHQGITPEAPSREATASPRTPLTSGPVGGARDVHAAQREVYALYEIARTLGSNLRLGEVLDLVVSRIAQLVPFRTCVVSLSDPGSGDLVARFASGANAAALRGRRLAAGEGISGWAVGHRSTRVSGSAELELAGSGVEPAGYGTVAAFPLCHGEEALGAITLLYPAAGTCQDDHVRVLEIVARLAAAAVHDGRLATAPEAPPLTDPVTHLPTDRYLRQVFEQETLRSQQSGAPLALVAMNLDDFGALSARLGQQVGDRFLMEVGRVLRSHLRGHDVLVRLGEDEYAALLPGSGFAAAALLSERLQQAVEGFAPRLVDDGPAVRAGLSAGIAIYPLDGEGLDDLIERARVNRARNRQARKEARAATPNIVPFRPAGRSS